MSRTALSSRDPRVALATVAAALAVAGAACGGGDAAAPVDAAVDASIDAFVCTSLSCDGADVDGCLDEDHCGDCTTTCAAGEACQAGACDCPPAFVSPTPGFAFEQLRADLLPGATLGIGATIDGTVNAMIVGYPTQTVQVARAYDLSGGTPGTPPFVGVGYDVDLDTQIPSASFYATRGTLTFTHVCAAGFAGTLTAAHFVAVEGLMNPTLVENGCAFDVPMVTFAYGEPCPSPD
jgi:hypothetical protein